jgi:opacity protein-like surface antigen
LIDNGPDNPGCGNAGSPPCRAGYPGPEDERNTINLERFWIDYKFYGTPFRMRVGADLWRTDLAGIVSDDDPRFALFYDGNPFQAYAAAVMEQESSRLGLTNDNDFVYYTFGGSFNAKPHRFAIDAVYFRERFTGATGNPVAQYGQKHDTVLVSPSWQGAFGPINMLLQGSFILGTAEGASLAGDPDLDVWAWSAIGYLDVDLGPVKPFIAMIYGSGDGDAGDDELNGFAPTPQANITLISGHPFFDTLDTSLSFGERPTAAPARAGYAGGSQFRHTVGSPYSDRIGRTAHRNAAGALVINSAYSNAGVLMPMAGIKTSFVKGHDFDLYWIWTLLDRSALLRQSALLAGVDPALASFDKNLTHELGFTYTWTLNPHFDIRLAGNMVIPQEGAKDIARTQDCDPDTPGLQACTGNDVALRGEARFRARF